MKWIFYFVIFMAIWLDMPNFVKEYHEVDSKQMEVAFINKYKSNKKPSVQAYVISLEMKQAEYKFFPWKKISIFNKGRRQLENLIRENPKNVDLRYVRLVIQENTPSILNYKSNIKEDKEFLAQSIKTNDSSDYLDTYIIKNTSL